MKKLIAMAVCTVFTIGASAQSFFSTETGEEPRIGIYTGFNLATLKSSESNDGVKNRAAFHVGISADFPIVESLHIVTGMNISSKGLRADYRYDDSTIKMNGKPIYMEWPVLASYRYNFNDETQLEVNVGPYFAFGLGGKVKTEVSLKGESVEETETIYFGSGNDRLIEKRFDCGIQLGAGVTLAQHYNIGLAYQFGLVNLIDSDDYSVKQRNLMISLGYKF